MRAVRRGVYCVDPHVGPTFKETVVATMLLLPAGTVASHLTAARLWHLEGLPAWTHEAPLDFLVPGRSDRAKLLGARLHTTRVPIGIEFPEGVPATPVARTLIDVAAVLEFADAVVLAESALRTDPGVATEIARARRGGLPRRGTSRVAAVLDFADVRSESVLESRARVVFASAGLPAPEQQAVIRADGRFVARVDFLWDQAKLIVEVDGFGKYAEVGALAAEKARQNALVMLGYVVLRFTWADVVGRPGVVIEQVRTALARAVS